MNTVTTAPAIRQSPALATWTVAQLHAMTAAGIIPDGEPVELINGILYRKDRSDRGSQKMNHGVRHATGVSSGARTVDRATGTHEVHVRVQLPITLSQRSEPEPDWCLVRGLPRAFKGRHPSAADLLLVAEVADSSLSFDRTVKFEMYALAGVALYWIVNLVDDCVEVYEDPRPNSGDYARHTVFRSGEMLRVPLPDGQSVEIPVDALI